MQASGLKHLPESDAYVVHQTQDAYVDKKCDIDGKGKRKNLFC